MKTLPWHTKVPFHRDTTRVDCTILRRSMSSGIRHTKLSGLARAQPFDCSICKRPLIPVDKRVSRSPQGHRFQWMLGTLATVSPQCPKDIRRREIRTILLDSTRWHNKWLLPLDSHLNRHRHKAARCTWQNHKELCWDCWRNCSHWEATDSELPRNTCC